MACFWLNQDDTHISIPRTEELEGVTVYVIEINISNVLWFVKHRYNDFYVLHQYLVADHGVSRDLLPPKKVIKNKCPAFIEQRRNGLEAYLKHVLKYFQCMMPRVFLHFLCFHQYDIFFLLQNMAYQLFTDGDAVLLSTKKYSFNVLQLHAISECFKKPYPNVEESDKRYDLCHVMDLCSQLHHLKINTSHAPYKTSNIVPNELPFELSAFKALQTLEIAGVNPHRMYAVGNLRETLKVFKIQYTSITSISDILMCDVVHKSAVTDNQVWQNVIELDLSSNNIANIDSSIKLVPQLCTLNLTQNQIAAIENLTPLASLSSIILSNNLITDCVNLHTRLGNVLSIDLSQNGLTSLKGFERLYSLENLDVSCNSISDIDEIKYIGELPCLESIRLTGNPVAVIVDYRVKVLEFFGSRASEIYLDNEKPTQKEIDTAFVLQALRILKEGKTPNLNQKFQ